MMQMRLNKRASQKYLAMVVSRAMTVSVCMPLWVVPALASGNQVVVTPQHKLLQGAVSQSDLIDLLERVGVKCAVHSDTGKLRIVDVHTGTDAFFQGVEGGDEIKTYVKQADQITLVCERNGKPYQVTLHTLKAQVDASSTDSRKLSASAAKDRVDLKQQIASVGVAHPPIVDVGQKSEPITDIGQRKIPIVDIGMPKVPITDIGQQKIPIVDVTDDKKREETILKNYDVELIIDITGSMSEHDGTGDLTKFEWCRDQVRSFVQRMAKYNHGINITIFNDDFQTFYNCTPGKVDEIYSEISPHGYTDLVDPLVARLNAIRGKHPGNGQPALLAVITDGLPNVPADPLTVNRALIAYSQGLDSPNQVVVTILQIGDTFDGRDFCLDLDDNLVNEGAKYDFIDTTTFAELKKEGLAAAMVKAIEEKRSTARKTILQKKIKRGLLAQPTELQQKKSAEQDAALKEQQDERHRIENELLGK